MASARAAADVSRTTGLQSSAVPAGRKGPRASLDLDVLHGLGRPLARRATQLGEIASPSVHHIYIYPAEKLISGKAPSKKYPDNMDA